MAVALQNTEQGAGTMGDPVQIIDITMNDNKSSRMSLYSSRIKAILENVGDRNLALISVCGPSRHGKSFLLNFMVRYLRALENVDTTDWIGTRNATQTLEGFAFQNRLERMTIGMWLWSRPFIIKNDLGEEIAVLLMDTQGVFDDHTTIKEWSAIVGISLLTSSCLIYNVSKDLQEDSLSILEMFLEFGKLAMDQSDSADACYQKLIFLIRDWNVPDDCEYGPLGGQKFLEHKLKIAPHLPPSSVRVRETIKRCFEEIDCFLMPDPGEIAKGNNFKGSLAELDEKFVKNLKTFMDTLLSPEQIVVKKINGQPMKAKSLFAYFHRYVTLFNNSGLPSPTNMLDATAHASCDVLVSKCVSSAKTRFLELLNNKEFINEGEWEILFNPLNTEALKEYDAMRKFGDPKIAQQQRRRLEGELLKLLTECKEKQECDINERSNALQNKLVEEFTTKVSQYLERGFLIKDQFEKIIFQETEISIMSFGSAFGNNKQILARNLPMLTEKLKTVAEQFRTQNFEKITKATEMANSSLEAAIVKYQDEMEFRILQIGDKAIQDELLLICDSQIRMQTLAFFRMLPKDGPQEFFDQFEKELEIKINEKFAQFASRISEKRMNMQSEIQGLIAEIAKLYLKEMSDILSQENAPNDIFLESKHLQLQNKYFDVFMAKCNIQDVSILMMFKQTFNESLQEALELAKQKLFQKQNEIRTHISTEIERLVENHHQTISKLLNEPNICTEQYLRNTQEKVVKFCQSRFNLPDFLKSEEKEKYNEILLSNLKQDFDFLLMLYQKKLQTAESTADNFISEIVENYRKAMNEKVNDFFEKSHLDECHMKEKNISENEFTQKVQFFPPEILNRFKEKLDFQLQNSYEIFVDRFERNMTEMEERVKEVSENSISKYSEVMVRKSQTNLDQDALQQWHELNKEKVLHTFDRELRGINMNCDPQRKKLERQLSEEFQNILLLKNANELEMKSTSEKHLRDCLEKFQREKPLIDEEKLKDEDSFMKSLNESKISTWKYFYENGEGIPKDLLNKTKEKLDEVIERQYHKICNEFKEKRGEELLKIDTCFATAVSKYQSVMDTLFLETSELLENSELEREHNKYTKEVIQGIPADVRDRVSHLVKEEINKMYENYKLMHEKRRGEFEKKLRQTKDELKRKINEIVTEKTNAATDPKDLQGLDAQLKQMSAEKLKSANATGGKLKTELLEELHKYIQEAINTAENEIKNREPDSKLFMIVKDSALQIYGKEMEKHFSVHPFMVPKVLADHHKIACKIAENDAAARINLTPKVVAELDSLFNMTFQKYQNRNRMNTPKNPAVGIDLGTTFSCVAVYNPGLKQVKIIPNENTKTTTPSYVAFTKDGVELIGEPAKNQAHSNPENTIFDAKRLIGRRFDEEVVQSDIKLWPFKVINENGVPKIQVHDKTYYPEEISAKVLKKMKSLAEMHLNCKVENAVITVPAYFNDGQKQATIHAGQVAGFNVLAILSEPTAAAIAYSLNDTYNKSRNVLIFDFGGGTFDVAVLSIHNGKINVKSVDGDTHLGGEDFDSNMVDFCVEQFQVQENIDLVADRHSENIVLRGDCNRRIRRLRQECEKRKIDLSGSATTTVALDSIYEGKDLQVEITRSKFEEMNSSLFDKSIKIVKSALTSAKLEKSEIDDIVLVGGSTQVPKIQELLTDFFDGRPLNRSVNPDEVVACGAAIHAAILNGCTAEELADIELSNVTPLSIGIEVFGGGHSVIIPRNTTIPVSASQCYSTVEDDQTSVNITIYEGEEFRAEANHLLGKFVLDGIPKARRGKPDIQVAMQIDTNGILNVTATCTDSGASKNLAIIQDRGRLTAEEIRKLATQK